MTAADLESRILEAEQNPSRIRVLIADFKTLKDAQISDLTTQVNAAVQSVQQAQTEVATLTAALATEKSAREKASADAASLKAATDAIIAELQSQLSASGAALQAMTSERNTLTETLERHQRLADECYTQSAPLLMQAKAITAANPILSTLDSLFNDLIKIAQTVGVGPQARIQAAAKARLDAAKEEARAAGISV